MSRSGRAGFPRGVTRVTGLTAIVGGLLLVAASASGSARPAGHRPLAAGQVARGMSATVSCTPGSPEQNLPQNGFICPVKIPNSSGLGEPSIVHDSQGRLFVTAPQAIGNVNPAGGSPLFTSANGVRYFLDRLDVRGDAGQRRPDLGPAGTLPGVRGPVRRGH